MLDLAHIADYVIGTVGAFLVGAVKYIHGELKDRPTREELILRLENIDTKIDNIKEDINDIKRTINGPKAD